MAATGNYDPTGGDFHTHLEEAIELVSQKNLDAAKNKKRAYKGFVTRLIGDCNKTRDNITQACPAKKEAEWNKTLLQKRCDQLLLSQGVPTASLLQVVSIQPLRGRDPRGGGTKGRR